MTVTADAIIARAAVTLMDSGYDHWQASELLAALNAGQREIVFLNNDANLVTTNMKLVAGVKQRIPDGSSTYKDSGLNTLAEGLALKTVHYNLGTSGTAAGNAIRAVDLTMFDISLPSWRTASADAVVKNVIFGLEDPKIFFVYPPQPSSGQNYILFTYSAFPDDLTSSTSNINLSDEYQNALYYYILYTAYSKDAEVPALYKKAQTYYQLFLGNIGLNPAVAKNAQGTE